MESDGIHSKNTCSRMYLTFRHHMWSHLQPSKHRSREAPPRRLPISTLLCLLSKIFAKRSHALQIRDSKKKTRFFEIFGPAFKCPVLKWFHVTSNAYPFFITLRTCRGPAEAKPGALARLWFAEGRVRWVVVLLVACALEHPIFGF